MVLISKIILVHNNDSEDLNSSQIADDEPLFVMTGESESAQHLFIQKQIQRTSASTKVCVPMMRATEIWKLPFHKTTQTEIILMIVLRKITLRSWYFSVDSLDIQK